MTAVVVAKCTAAGVFTGSRQLLSPQRVWLHAPPFAGRQRRSGCALYAIPAGLGDATSAAVPQLLEGVQQAASNHAALYTLEALLAAAAAYVAAVWPARPRGWCFQGLLAARPSPVAGKGVFALVHIQAGTVLGAYPGRPRTPQQMAAKVAAAPPAASYCFRTRSGQLLDPTDAAGQLSASPVPGLPWLPIDYTLAYINEPPLGAGGCNVTVEDDTGDPCGLLCVAARDIKAGEELYMDYGVHYDRSMYSQPTKNQQQRGQQHVVKGGMEASTEQSVR